MWGVPDNSVAVGIPAHVIETIDDYYNKIILNHDCLENMNEEEKKRI